MKSKNRKHVVILGGGYVGVHAYRALMRGAGQLIRSRQLSITVVDPQTHHTFHGWSGETIAGVISDENRLSPLREVFRHARVVRGYGIRIDRETNSVLVKPVGSEERIELRYDHLVIGTGVRDLLESIPGVGEYGVTLRGQNGPDGLRRRVIELAERAEAEPNPEIRREMLTFVVAGGGFTGVEIAAAIAELLKTMKPRYPVLQKTEPQIVLVHSGGTILPQLQKNYSRLVDYAMRSLLDYGIRFRLWTRMTRVTPEGAELNDGTFIRSRTVISTIGVSMRTIPGTEDFRRDELGRIHTSREMRGEGSENIWVGGDAAHVRQPGTTGPCPQNALWGIKHGEHIGKNILRCLNGLQPKAFTYPGLGQAASFGIGKGIVELRGMQFTGVIGWLMRLCFFLYFMPSRRVALRALTEWLTLPVGGRHLTLSGENTTGLEAAPPQRIANPLFRIGNITWDRN